MKGLSKMKSKIDYLTDIKVMTSFQQVINALHMIINIIKIAAIAFLALQALLMFTKDNSFNN